jgi:sulfur-oxidizing protein SoxX
MTLAKRILSVSVAVAFALTAGSSLALAQAKKKKSKCKDGETEQVASYKLSKGTNIDQQIKASLTGKSGDSKSGLKWMTHRRLGNCIACHEVKKILSKAMPGNTSSQKKYGFHGKIAPPLDGVADRYTEGELRLIVVSAKKAFPDADTIMPSYHVKDGFNRVHKDCVGQAIFTAERVEDVIAYLKTLKE